MNLSGDTFKVLTIQRGAYALLLTQVEVLARLELLNKDVSVLTLQAVGLLDLVFTSHLQTQFVCDKNGAAEHSTGPQMRQSLTSMYQVDLQQHIAMHGIAAITKSVRHSTSRLHFA